MVRNYKRKTEDRWSKEDLLRALTSIKDTKLKINEAARVFGISRATLYRQYSKFRDSGGVYDINQFRTCGGNPILTRIEEDVLEKTILDLREQGFSVTSSDIKRICYEYCDSNGIQNQFNAEKRMASDDWYYGFLKRHPNVKVSKSPNYESNESSEARQESGDEEQEDEEEEEEAPKVKKVGRVRRKVKRLKSEKLKKIKNEGSKKKKRKAEDAKRDALRKDETAIMTEKTDTDQFVIGIEVPIIFQEKTN